MYNMINEYKVWLWCHENRHPHLGTLFMYHIIIEYSMKFIIYNYKCNCSI